MSVCGVDPGKTGGMVLLRDDGAILGSLPFDDLLPATVAEYLRDWAPTHTFVEQVSAMPGQGVVSMFTFGRVFGEVLGILAALDLPHTLVRPALWQKVLYAGVSGDGKERSRIAAARLFPAEKFHATPRSRSPHGGLVDAALIAEYGRRTILPTLQAKAAWRRVDSL